MQEIAEHNFHFFCLPVWSKSRRVK